MNRIMTDYERVAYKFMPALRQYTVYILVNEMHMNQKEAAMAMGVTQAAISKYLNKKKISKETSSIMSNFNSSYVYDYVKNVLSKNDINAQKSVCHLCQSYHKFDCNMMVK